MVIPRSQREEAGIPEGTLMKVAVIQGGRILLTPQFIIDRSVFADSRNMKRKPSTQELAQVVAERRREATEKGLDKMPKREINAALAAARRDLKKSVRPVSV